MDERPEQGISASLLDASRIVREVTQAASTMDAIRATLRGACLLCGTSEIWLEVQQENSEAPIVIASERNRTHSPDERVIRLGYPLEVDHPAWKHARVVVMQPIPRISGPAETRMLSALLSILIDTISRRPDLGETASNPAIHMTRSLSALLWSYDSTGDLREQFANWIGKEFGADFVSIHTHIAVDEQTIHPGTGFAGWPSTEVIPYSTHIDVESWQTIGQELDLATLHAHHSPASNINCMAIAGRTAPDHTWTSHEHDHLAAAVRVFSGHVLRVTDRNLSSIQSRYLAEMQEFTAAASSASDFEALFDVIEGAVLQLLPAESLSVRLNMPDTADEISFDTSSGSTCLRTSAGTDTLDAAIRSENRTIGLISVDCSVATGFGQEHSAILEAIAQCSVGAVERLMLLSQLDRQMRYETGLRLIAERISGTIDANELMQIASDVIFDTVPCEVVAVSIIDRRTLRVRARSMRSRDAGITAPPLGFKMQPGSLSSAAINERRQIEVSGDDRDLYTTFEIEPWMSFETTVATPIHISNELVGIMLTGRVEQDGFSDDELSLQRHITDMLATALENAFSFADRLRHTRDLGELQQLGARIAAQLDLNESLEEIVASATSVVHADGGAVAMLDGDALKVVESIGIVQGKIPERLPLGDSFLDRVLFHDGSVVIDDMEHAREDYSIAISGVPYARAMMAVSLVDPDGTPFGMVGVFSSLPRTWTERDLSLLMTLSSSAAVAVQNARHFESTRDVLRASVESLATAVGAKDPGAQHHARNVARFARVIAEQLGLQADAVGEIELAGLLHDVGKIGIPDHVLEKTSPLDAAEWAAIHLHPAIGEQILSGNPALAALLPMIRHHHERWDGHGYPDQLREADIPMGSAVVSVAEALDAMTTDRPYQPAINWHDAVEEIRSGSGSQFSPVVVAAFQSALDAGSFIADELRVAESASKISSRTVSRSTALDVRALRIFETVASELREGADISTFLGNIATELCDILNVPYLAIYVREDEHAPFKIVAATPASSSLELMTQLANDGKGIVGWVARQGVIQNVPDVSQDDRYLEGGYEQATVSELCVPLFAEGHVVGVMNLESYKPAAFTEADEQLMVSAADHIANAIHVVQLHERIRQLSNTDALTGLYNHRSFFEKLETLTQQAVEEGSELSVAIMDVNELKAINDSYGHLAGDAALKAVAEVLLTHRRHDDVVCRYGGDEFALILPRTSNVEAWGILETLAVELLDGEFDVQGMTMPLPTSSWGIATLPDHGVRAMELLALADERMYHQKTGGRI